MNFEVHMTRHAYADLQEALDYISFELYNPDAADHLQDKVEDVVHDLVSYPKKYPLAADEVLRNWQIRFVMINDYYLFYTIRGNKIYVVRFLYKRRDWMATLREGIDLD